VRSYFDIVDTVEGQHGASVPALERAVRFDEMRRPAAHE